MVQIRATYLSTWFIWSSFYVQKLCGTLNESSRQFIPSKQAFASNCNLGKFAFKSKQFLSEFSTKHKNKMSVFIVSFISSSKITWFVPPGVHSVYTNSLSSTIISLIAHSHSPISSFFAYSLSFAILQSVKYLPVTASKSGSTASATIVCDPDLMVFMNSDNGDSKISTNGRCIPNSMRMIPGCSELAVTPVGSSRLANALVKITVSSLLWKYAWYWLYEWYWFKSKRLMWAYRCDLHETLIMRLGADALSVSNRRLVSKKCPK